MFLLGYVRFETKAGLRVEVYHRDWGGLLLAAPAAEDLEVGDLVYVEHGRVYKDKRMG